MKKEIEETEKKETKYIEAYKTLQITIQHLMNKMDLKTIAFSSLSDIEDNTRHIFNVAKLMANEGKKTLLLRCTFRNSGIDNHREDVSNLYVSLCEQKVEDSEYVLNVSNITMILEDVKEKYDIILIDSPPVGYCADGIRLCAAADGTVLIMKAGKTSVELATKTKRRLDTMDARVIGAILEK